MEETAPYEIPEEPEIYEILRRTEFFKAPFFSGGWHKWPHIFVQEMEQALLAERTLNRELDEMRQAQEEAQTDGNTARTAQSKQSASD